MKKTAFLIKSFYLCCALLFLSAESMAAAPAPRKIHVGLFINRINSFDVKTGTAEVDFWFWAISNGESVSLQNLELSNGKLEPVGDPITQKRKEKHYIARRYIAYAKCVLNLRRFPFDVQHIVLSFEDGELTKDQMVFVPDIVNSGIDPTCRMNEWDIKKVEYKVGIHHYSSSFGYLDIPSGKGSFYSQFNGSVTLARRGNFLQKLFKYFWAVIISVMVGLFSLLIRVCDLDGRFGMAVGALFANVGCSYLLSDKLPQSPGVTLAELVSYISLGFIMLFLIESIVSLNIYNRGYQNFSQKLDHIVFGVSLISYSGIWFFI